MTREERQALREAALRGRVHSTRNWEFQTSPRVVLELLKALDEAEAEVEKQRGRLRLVTPSQDGWIRAAETVGSALAVLRRLDYGGLDADISSGITAARAALSVTLSKIKERIDG